MIELFFDEENHIYKTRDGEVLPSVSDIIREVGLSSGGDYVTDSMLYAMALGTKIHKNIEAYNIFGAVPTESSVLGHFSAYLKWFEDYAPKVIENELRMGYMGSPVRYAGTADLIAEIDGRLAIIDYKTGKSIYPYYSYQLAGYKKLYGEDVDLYVLQLKASGDYIFVKSDFMIPNCVERWEDVLVSYSKGEKYVDLHELETDEDAIKWLAFKEEMDKTQTKIKRIENKLSKTMKNVKAENEIFKYKYNPPKIKEEFSTSKFLYQFDDDGLFSKEDVQNALKGCFKITVGKKVEHVFTKKKKKIRIKDVCRKES